MRSLTQQETSTETSFFHFLRNCLTAQVFHGIKYACSGRKIGVSDMTLLLYFVSFVEVLVLLTSATAVTGWLLFKLLDRLVRIYLVVTQPETMPPKKRTLDSNLDHLKRAGHW